MTADQDESGKKGRLFDPSHAHKLDDPERLTWMPPGEVVALLKPRPGMNVADIGAGTGYFALPLAREIAPGGVVYAVDVQPEMLDRLKEKLASEDSPGNIVPVEGDAVATHLPDRCVELVLMANLWHELDDQAAALGEAARILRPGGRLAALDWRQDVEPPPGPPLEHRIPMEQVAEFLQVNGWPVEHAGGVGRYSYLLLATVPGSKQPLPA